MKFLDQNDITIANNLNLSIRGSSAAKTIFRNFNSKRRILLASFVVTFILLLFSFRPAWGAEITEYNLAGDYRPLGITVDTDGNVWFTEQLGNKIGRKTGSTIHEWNVPTLGSEPWDITYDEEENIWFTEFHSSQIGRFKNGVFIEFVLDGSANPTGITVDNNDTQNVWFTESNGDKIGKIYFSDELDGWVIVEYEVPDDDNRPFDIVVSSVDDLVWFTELEGTSGNVASFNPWTGVFREYTLGLTNTMPRGIDVDSDGFIWLALDTSGSYDKIGRLNPWNSELTLYDIPTQNADPHGIDVDEDNNIWFTEYSKAKIGSLNPVTRYITEYETPTSGSYPLGISTMSDGDTPIWFTEWSSNKIGRLNPDIGKSYSTVTTITSATTTIQESRHTATEIGSSETHTTYSTDVGGSQVTFWTASGTSSTDRFATSSMTTNTETVFVMPTSTTVTTTSYIVSTSTTSTTLTATLTTFISTTSTTTTTTLSATLSIPAETSSTTITREGIFTDIVSTTTLTEFAATSFIFKTTTVQFYTSYRTLTELTTTTLSTTVTTTVTTLVTVTAGLGIPGLFSALIFALTTYKRRKKV